MSITIVTKVQAPGQAPECQVDHCTRPASREFSGPIITPGDTLDSPYDIYVGPPVEVKVALCAEHYEQLFPAGVVGVSVQGGLP